MNGWIDGWMNECDDGWLYGKMIDEKMIYKFLYIYFFYKWFNQMWLNEEARIAKLLILTSSPGPTALHPLRRMW